MRDLITVLALLMSIGSQAQAQEIRGRVESIDENGIIQLGHGARIVQYGLQGDTLSQAESAILRSKPTISLFSRGYRSSALPRSPAIKMVLIANSYC